jgi:hypothetical protein
MGNYNKGIGSLGVSRYDFQKHIEGTDFKHQASGIDLSDPLSELGNATNLQDAFDNLNDYIEILNNAGQGMVTVGDGYDTWHNADGNINYDNTIPSLNLILKPIFDAIINNTALPAAYSRIKRGGVMVIKAGTYTVTDTIDVPAGITILGEGWGTKIVNATSLDLTISPPNIDMGGTPKPIFRVKVDSNRSTNDTAIDASLFMFSRQTKIANLVIADNFVENTILGDIYYKLPQNKTGDTPLISQEAGSNLVLENVMMIGRVTFSSGKIVSAATRFGVQLDTSTAITTGTFLQLNKCFMDGFSQPISYSNIGGSEDFLEVVNSRIRSHGYLDGYQTEKEKNCIVFSNGCNTRLVSNHFFGNHSYSSTILYINDFISGSVFGQNKAKVLVASNDIVINKGTSTIADFFAVYVNPTNLTSSYTKATIQTFGNHYQPQYGFEIDSSFRVRTNTVSGNYTLDGYGGDYIVLVDTSSVAANIDLPIHVKGRQVIIKDISQNSSVNNITVTRYSNTGEIEGYAGDRVLATNGASWTLVSSGTNWYLI